MAELGHTVAEDHLVEIDRRLRRIQLELAPGREPAPVREPAPAAIEAAPAPLMEPSPRPEPNVVVTTKLIASMRELLDALESATVASDRPANH